MLMDYQLLLQWSCGSNADDFDALCEIEELLIQRLPAGNEVDGHDIGSREMNIFIFTDDPLASFEQAKNILESLPAWQRLRPAYRETSGDEYTVVWPKGLKKFSVV